MKAIERLYQYLERKNIKPTVFERNAGVSSGYLSKQFNRKADIGESILVLITENCPEMSISWLLTGHGSMLREDQPQSQPSQMVQPADESLLYKMYKEKDAEASALREEVGSLKKEIENLNTKITLMHKLSSHSLDAEYVKTAPVVTK